MAEFERLIATGLAHPALVAPLVTGIQGVTPYLVQEYVAAESLDVWMRHGSTPPGGAVRVAIDLAGVLDTAATVGVDHGVLHPRDVLLSPDETRLTGLGIARALERVGITPPVRRPYTAPERCEGGLWDRRADVFGLAALVHEMLWGRRLTGVGEEAAGSLTAIAGADMDALRQAFARALAEHPGERFTSALEFAGALADAFSRPAAALPLPAADFAREADLAPRLPLEPDIDPEEVAFESVADPDADKFVSLDSSEPAEAADAAEFVPLDTAETPETPETIVAEPMLLRMPATQAELFDSYRPSQDHSGQDEGARSSMWPLAFALLIGGALGFAAGFGVGTRGRSADAPDFAPTTAEATAERQPSAGTSGAAREFTEAPVTGSAGGNVPLPPSGDTTPVVPGAAASSEADARRVAPAPPATSRAAVAPKVETGSLLVRSTPLGARVFIDNRDYGRTPVTVNALARGAHRVRVTRDGYQADERQVTITSAQRAHSITVRLQAEQPPQTASSPSTPPARTPGGAAASSVTAAPAAPAVLTGNGPLVVESRPAGAKVFVDGKLVGTTPLTLPAVPAGDHAVHLDLDGYRRWSSAIRIIPTAKNRVAASLDR